MKLSIIVPVYKAESTLRPCVDSLLAQKLEDYEIILVNDGSPDRCQEIIETYERKYPYLVHGIRVENGGQGRARNIGIEAAKGAFLGFVDSDDWVADTMYPELLAAAERERADVVVCDIMQCYEDGQTVLASAWQEGKPLASAGSACDKLFRRSVVGEIRFPEGLWYEDLAFSAKLLLRSAKTVHVPQALYYYRCGLSSTMNNQNAVRNLDMLTIMDQIGDFLLQEGKGSDRLDYLILGHVLLDSINRLARQDNAEKNAVITRMRDYVHRKIPDLARCPAYQDESRKRRMIMKLNYMGRHELAKALLSIKKAL